MIVMDSHRVSSEYLKQEDLGRGGTSIDQTPLLGDSVAGEETDNQLLATIIKVHENNDVPQKFISSSSGASTNLNQGSSSYDSKKFSSTHCDGIKSAEFPEFKED